VPILRLLQRLGQRRRDIPADQSFPTDAMAQHTFMIDMKVFGPGNTVATSDIAPLITKEIMVQICPWMFLFARHPSQATMLSCRGRCQ
jgi:hypothetical protein